MPGWYWGIITLVILVIIIVIILRISANKKIDEVVANEIAVALIRLEYNNYMWQNMSNLNNLKNQIKGCIMDNRKNWPMLARSYINNSPRKLDEIKNIVKRFVELDQHKKEVKCFSLVSQNRMSKSSVFRA